MVHARGQAETREYGDDNFTVPDDNVVFVTERLAGFAVVGVHLGS